VPRSAQLWRLACCTLALAALVLAPVRNVYAAEEDGPVYIVEAGESLYTIAQLLGTTVDALQQANAIEDPGVVAVGQRLLVPGFAGLRGVLATHPLAAGDSLPNLLYRLRSDQQTLVRLNRVVNPAALFLGQSFLFLAGDGEQAVLPAQRAVVLQPGETLALLAARAGLTLQQLALTNQLSSLAAAPGIQLQLPAPAENSLPLPFQSITVYPDHPAQGEPLAVVLTLASTAVLSGEFDGETLHFSQLGAGQIALHGVNAITEPGVYALRVRAQPPRGAAVNVELRVRVSNANFAQQLILLQDEKAALLNDPQVGDGEVARIQAVAKAFTATRLWTAAFVQPISSEYITTKFGLRRSYNGSPFRTFHGGIDFGAPAGTPIRAAAGGVVALADQLQIRGGATMLDHGWGVFTAYWHQASVLVKPGQAVQAGEVIGTVGNTGLSTGTHLHWEVWANGNQVDPTQWLALEVPELYAARKYNCGHGCNYQLRSDH
jgi:murein DD-endopeptidase MepM/ murein hydrolase activator NlpD